MTEQRRTTPEQLERVRAAIERHHIDVFRIALRVLRNVADAQDVAQDVFVKLLVSPDALDGVQSERAWLARVTAHAAVSRLRSDKRRRDREARWSVLWRFERERRGGNGTIQNDQTMDAMDSTKNSTADPSSENGTESAAPLPGGAALAAAALDDARRAALDAAVAELPDELRVPVVLHYQEGFKYREIATACGCPEGTIARRLSVARDRLRKRLAGKGALAAVPLSELLGKLPEVDALAVPPGLESALAAHVEAAYLELAASGAAAGAAAPVASTTASASGTAMAAAAALRGSVAFKVAAAVVVSTALAALGWVGIDRAASSWTQTQEGLAPSVARRASVSTGASDEQPAPRSTNVVRGGRPARAVANATAVDQGASDEAAAGESASAAVGGAPGTASVFGHVRDAEGRPLAGVTVVAMSGSDGSPIAPEVTTDDNGAYEIHGLPVETDSYVFFSDAGEGYADFSAATRLVGAADNALTLRMASRQLTVLAETAAREDEAARRLSLDLTGLPPQPMVERHEFADASGGPVAEVVQDTSRSVASAEATAAAEAAALDAQIRLWEVRAEVQAEALAEAQIVSSYEAAYRAQTFLASGAVDTSAFTSPAIRIAARLDGYEAVVSDELRVKADEAIEMDFALAKTFEVGGVVVDANGHRLPGVTVEVVAESPPTQLPGAVRRVESDEDGAFAFPSLPAGVYVLRAASEGFLPAEVIARPGDRTVLALQPSASLEALVFRRPTGEPLEGFRVEVLVETSTGPEIIATAQSDEEGLALVDSLEPGTYVVRTYRESSESKYVRSRVTLDVGAGTASEIDLPVEFTAKVEGHLLLADGSAGGRRLVVTASPVDALDAAPGGELKRAELSDDGCFSFEHLPPGEFRIEVRRADSGAVLGSHVLDVLAGETSLRVDIPVDAPGRSADSVRDEALDGAIAALDAQAKLDEDLRLVWLERVEAERHALDMAQKSAYLDMVSADVPRVAIHAELRLRTVLALVEAIAPELVDLDAAARARALDPRLRLGETGKFTVAALVVRLRG